MNWNWPCGQASSLLFLLQLMCLLWNGCTQKIEQTRRIKFDSVSSLGKDAIFMERKIIPISHFVGSETISKLIINCKPSVPANAVIVNWQWSINDDGSGNSTWLAKNRGTDDLILTIDGQSLLEMMIENRRLVKDYTEIQLSLEGILTYMMPFFSYTDEGTLENSLATTNFEVISEDDYSTPSPTIDDNTMSEFSMDNTALGLSTEFQEDPFLGLQAPSTQNSLFGLVDSEKDVDKQRRPATLPSGISVYDSQFAKLKILLYLTQDAQQRIFPTVSFNTIFNPRTERWLLTNTDKSIPTTILQPNDDVILICDNNKECEMCSNNKGYPEVDQFRCIVATGCWLNVKKGIWRIPDNILINGYLQIEQFSTIEFDGGPDSLYVIDTREEATEVSPPILNHGTIRVKSGHLIMKNQMIGSGKIEVFENAILEFRSEFPNSWMVFNRTAIDNAMHSELQWTTPTQIELTDDIFGPVLSSSGSVYFQSGKFRFHSCIRTQSKGSENVFYVSSQSLLQLDDCDPPIELESEFLNTTTVEKDVRQGYQLSNSIVANEGTIEILQTTLHISPRIFLSKGLMNVSEGGEIRFTLTDRDENEMNGLAVDKNMISDYTEIFETSPTSELATERAIALSDIPYGGIALLNKGLVELRTGRMRFTGGLMNVENAHLFLRRHTQVIVNQTLKVDVDESFVHSTALTRPVSSSQLILAGLEVHSQGILNIESGWLEIASTFYQINGAQLTASGKSTIVLKPPQTYKNTDEPQYTFTPCSRGSSCEALQQEGSGTFITSPFTTVIFAASTRGRSQEWYNRGRSELDYGVVISVGQFIQDDSESLLMLMGRAGIYAPIVPESSMEESFEKERCLFQAGYVEGNGGIQCTHVTFEKCAIKPYLVEPNRSMRPETPEPLPSIMDIALTLWDAPPILAIGGHVTFTEATSLIINVESQNMGIAIAVGGYLRLGGNLQLTGSFPLKPKNQTTEDGISDTTEYLPLTLLWSEGGIRKTFDNIDRSQLIEPEGFSLKFVKDSTKWLLLPVPLIKGEPTSSAISNRRVPFLRKWFIWSTTILWVFIYFWLY